MDPASYLTLLKERNDELTSRFNKLEKLSTKIDASIENLQDLYEILLSSQEQRCVEMTKFDEEIKVMHKKLFPPAEERKTAIRQRDENKKIILEELKQLKALSEEECIAELLKKDALINAVAVDVDAWNEFLTKYENVLL